MRNFLIMSLLSMVSFDCFAMQTYDTKTSSIINNIALSPHIILMLKLDSAEYKKYCAFSENLHSLSWKHQVIACGRTLDQNYIALMYMKKLLVETTQK